MNKKNMLSEIKMLVSEFQRPYFFGHLNPQTTLSSEIEILASESQMQ